MKKCVIFMDCHGLEIYKYLYHNKTFINDFGAKYVILNNYVVNGEKYYNNTELVDSDLKKIETADVLILQVIEKNRGFLNNSEIIKLCKSNCKVIKIPHYRNSIYEYKCIENKNNKNDLLQDDKWNLPNKIKDKNNIDEIKKNIQNEIDIMNNFPHDEDEMLKNMNLKINEFAGIDSLSDIKMLDYFNNNFKKYRLFQGRSYPSSIFFFELTNRILNTLHYTQNMIFKDTYFAQNTGEPIPNYWYKFCKFTFDNIYFTFGNIPITECEWYYILLLSKNVNIGSKEKNLKLLEKIRKNNI